MTDGRGDGPFSVPGKLEALFGELGSEPVELLLAVDSVDDDKTDTNPKMLMFQSYFAVRRRFRLWNDFIF